MSDHTKVRTRAQIKSNPEYLAYYVNGGFLFGGPTSEWYHYGYMADQINPFRPNGFREPGLCNHLVVDKIYKSQSLSIYNGNDTVSGDIGGLKTWPNGLHGFNSPTGSLHPDDLGYSNMFGTNFMDTAAYQRLLVSAFVKQSQQVPPDISILNFIYELKDFKGLTKSLAKIPKHLKDGSLAKAVSAPAKRPRHLPKKVAKAGVDSFLSYNFQWAPFVGDIITLMNIYSSSVKRLDYLRKTRGKSARVRYHKVDCFVNPSVGSVLHSYAFGSGRIEFILRDYTCNFQSTWSVFQELEGLDDAFASLRTIFAKLGLNNPVKAAWNAIPFSFMLDWVGPFGDWLEKAAVQPFYGRWDVSGVTSSVNEWAVIDVYFQPNPGFTDPRQLLETTRVSRYLRLDGLPVQLGAIDLSQLSDTQLKLAASIPLSKILG